MQITVTGRHMELTDAIRDHSHAKIEQAMLEFPRVGNAHLILAVEKYRHIAEIVIDAPNHIRVEAREESDDMYASIDGSIDKAAKQLRRHWDKMQDHKSREKLGHLESQTQGSEDGAG